MAKIRKRKWINRKGEEKLAWVVDYKDQLGVRRFKQFPLRREADSYLTKVRHEVSQGRHTPESLSTTIANAADLWLKRARREELEPTTIDSYAQHVRLHIVPFLGETRLCQLTKPDVERFRDQLLDSGRSRDMVGRVLRSLAAIVGEAERLGYIGSNVARGVRLRRARRDKSRPTIPTKAELGRLIEAASDARPGDEAMMMVLIFAGLRASELRALPWRGVDLNGATITIEQRADRTNRIGAPKSASGRRTIPIPGQVVAALRRWKLRCPPSALDLVFPSSAGTPQFHPNIVAGFLEPIQLAAGLSKPRTGKAGPVIDDNSEPVLQGIYTLHSLRHAAASIWIDQCASPKRVQTWMGHHSIQVTFDTYGHLFAALADDSKLVDAAFSEIAGTQSRLRDG